MAKFLKAKVVFTLAESEYGSEHEDTVFHTFAITFQAITYLRNNPFPVNTLFHELKYLTATEENKPLKAMLNEEYDNLPKELKT